MPFTVQRRPVHSAPNAGALAMLCLPVLPVALFLFAGVQHVVNPPPDPSAARSVALARVFANPTDPAARCALAHVLGPIEAIPHLAVAARFRPHDPVLLCELGDSYRDVRSYAAASDCYRRASRLDGDGDPGVLYELGRSLLSTGKPDCAAEAVVSLEHAARLAPENAETEVVLGEAYAAVGRLPQAQSAWRQAIALDPDGVAAVKAELRLRRMAVSLSAQCRVHS